MGMPDASSTSSSELYSTMNTISRHGDSTQASHEANRFTRNRHLAIPILSAMASSAVRSGPSPATTKRTDGSNWDSSLATDKNNAGPFSGARRPTKPTTLYATAAYTFGNARRAAAGG